MSYQTKQVAEDIILAILDDMSDRSGLGNAIEEIDSETLEEIKSKWVEAIASILDDTYGE